MCRSVYYTIVIISLGAAHPCPNLVIPTDPSYPVLFHMPNLPMVDIAFFQVLYLTLWSRGRCLTVSEACPPGAGASDMRQGRGWSSHSSPCVVEPLATPPPLAHSGVAPGRQVHR